MSGALKPQPLLDEIAAQDALAHQFRKLGLEFSGLQPTIRTVMKRAVIATGDVRQQAGEVYPGRANGRSATPLRSGKAACP